MGGSQKLDRLCRGWHLRQRSRERADQVRCHVRARASILLTFLKNKDSVEFSTLGGWIATRCSGMKKNAYGNIEDIVINVKFATSIGTFFKGQTVPRLSSGPDINEIVMGSEGTLGVVTEAVIKISPKPELKIFDSILFPDFETGIKFLKEVAQSKFWPASLRLVDNAQIKFGYAVEAEKPKSQKIKGILEKLYISHVKKFDLAKVSLAILVYEGPAQKVKAQQEIIKKYTRDFKGIPAENGKRGYSLTFMIAYLRDFALDFGYFGESFETSCSWKNLSTLCKSVEERIYEDCLKLNLPAKPLCTIRIPQIYDTGATIYFYLGFHYAHLKDPLGDYSVVEDNAREEIMKQGGSISHHHGIGKIRKKFTEKSIGATGVKILRGIKQSMDPKNVFANGNLIDLT